MVLDLSTKQFSRKGLHLIFQDGAHLLMPSREIVGLVYANMFVATGGKSVALKALLERFRKEISFTSECQIHRLKLICKYDAFLNAFVKTQIIVDFLNVNPEQCYQELLTQFDSGI